MSSVFPLDMRKRDLPLDNTTGNNTLLAKRNVHIDNISFNASRLPKGRNSRIKVSTRLINKVDIGRFSQTKDNSDSLKFSSRKRGDILIHQHLKLHRLDDIGVELRVHERSSNLLDQEFSNATGEFGSNGLGLHGDSDVLDVVLVIR